MFFFVCGNIGTARERRKAKDVVYFVVVGSVVGWIVLADKLLQ